MCIYDEFEDGNEDDDDDDDNEENDLKRETLSILWKKKYFELEKETRRLRKLLNIKEGED